jgi:hypothetical protein
VSRLKLSQIRKSRRLQRTRRHFRVRNKVEGTGGRPRLVVFRSNRNIEGQLVDDGSGRTLAGISTLAEGLRSFEPEGKNRKVEHAFAAGKPWPSGPGGRNRDRGLRPRRLPVPRPGEGLRRRRP